VNKVYRIKISLNLQIVIFNIMKKIIASAVFVIATFSMSCCQSATSDKQQSVLGPGIEFEVTEHNFGIIPQDGDGAFDFVFTNTGTEPLILSNVRSSCGCTVPSWPHEPIAVGAKESIKVKYDTKRIGQFNKTISVYSNAKEEPIILKISGEVQQASAEAPK
jgi:hypothetical protein